VVLQSEQIQQPGTHGLVGVPGDGCMPGGVAEPGPECGLLGEREQNRGQLVDVVLAHDHRAPAVGDRLGDPGVVGHDARPRGGHRLEHSEGLALAVAVRARHRRVHDDVGPRGAGEDLPGRAGDQQPDGVHQVQRAHQVGEVVPQRPVADDVEGHAGLVPAGLSEGVKQAGVALLLDEPADRQAPHIRSAAPPRRPAGHVDMVGADMHTVGGKQVEDQPCGGRARRDDDPRQPGQAGVARVQACGQVGAMPADPDRDLEPFEQVESAVGEVEVLHEQYLHLVVAEEAFDGVVGLGRRRWVPGCR